MEDGHMGRRSLDFTVRRRGSRFADFTAEADPRDPDELRQLLTDAIRRDGWDASRIGEFEMEVRYTGDRRVLTTFVTTYR
jgi:integrase